ncbi:DNA/RNA helicases, SNF2 family [hydrothermal vent metagenome]|uniref:DNA/RNA helicases, SNF2 family n=1 Tax=hydrothermal vent metagenome TaxID=652676 RepID=A0A3B0XG81_9ZZZZ
MFNFQNADIKNETDSGSFSRGLNYFKQGMVISLDVNEINDYTISLSSEVSGSGYNPYEQMILIEKSYQSLDIDGQCTCPVGFNCKHVVASCLEYLSRQKLAGNATRNAASNKQANKKIDSSLFWLSEFASASPQKKIRGSTVTAEPKNEFINYILTQSMSGTGISICLLKNRILKNGGPGKGRSINLDDLIDNYSQPSYAQNIDIEIAQMIDAQNEYTWGEHEFSVSGDLGELILIKILGTGRSHWLSPYNPALKQGESRKLHLNWMDEKNGDKRLEVKLQPEASTLHGYPPLYYDTTSNEIGKISGADFTERQWNMLLDMPPIPADTCTAFSQQLLANCPGSSLPPPQKIDQEQVSESAIPGLFLYGVVNPDNGYRTHLMRLRFHYGEYEVRAIPWDAVSTFIRENRYISVNRDLISERKATSRLTDADFLLTHDAEQEDILFLPSSGEGRMALVSRWQHLLHEILPQLTEEGWEIEIDPSFQLEFLQADNWDVEIESDAGNDWFDLRFDLEVDGQKIPLLPLIANVLSMYEPDNLPEMITLPMNTVIGNNKYLQIPSERIRPIFKTLYELFNTESLDENGNLRLSRFDATRLAELEDSLSNELNWRGGAAMRKLGRKLKNFKGIRKVAPPRGLKATLRDYQQQGLNWLQFLREYEFNGILADDMGLGKTVQTLTHLLKEKERKRLDKPSLILAPTSLMSNWRREAEQFTPQLKVLVLQGADRKQHFDKIKDHDLILSTYPLLARDQETLLAHEYYYFILDEAQVIKNPKAKAARAAREVKAQHRLCLTGTPMENHLGELWALFDFLMPGCLGQQKAFNQNFRKPIEKHGDDEQRERLVNRISPFMLRRSKTEVVKELPKKTEIIRSVALDKKQAALYESIRLSMEKKVRDAIKQKGLARSHITILDALLKLRQTCCDPRLLSLEQAKKVKSSAKMEMLMEMLPEMLEEGRRILLFSQFTKMLAIIEQQLRERDISYTKLTGKTINREKVIDEFKEGKANVFLISLKAGGVGLNLTEADTVIHYDPWWNPAVENQATDRAHRIGQNKAVFVYKLITENTLEEKILLMQARKQALADGVYNKKNTGKDYKLTADDLQELFSPLGS